MEYAFTDQQELIRSTTRQIAREQFAGDAFTWDGVPWENMGLLGDRGLIGIPLSEEYGGDGGTVLEQVLVIEEVGRVCPDTAFALFEASLGPSYVIDTYGTDEQKATYLPGVAAGEDIIAIAMSEPEAGTDATNIQTEARIEDGTVVLNGQKTYVSNAAEASAFLVYVLFDDGWIGSVIVDREDITNITLQENMMGHMQGDLFFDDAEVPVENVLLQGEDAFAKQLRAFNTERLGNATMGLSIAENAFDRAIDYATTREQFDQPLVEFQVIREKLATMAIEMESARLLIYRAADMAADGPPERIVSSIAKTKANEMAPQVVDEALQIHGGAGYLTSEPIEYLYRAARAWKIAGGTVEIQREMIANDLLERGQYEIPP